MNEPTETTNYAVNSGITEGGITQPRVAKGGVYAPADVKLIKDALTYYVQSNDISEVEQRQIANLLHRLTRI